MNMLASSYAVSPSGGDVRGDGPVPWAPKMPQDRFADIPILANAGAETRSDSEGDGEDDLDADVQRDQDARNARERDRSIAQSGPVASDAPVELPMQTKGATGKGDSTSAQSSKTSDQESVTAESSGAGSTRQAAPASQLGKDGKPTQAAGGADSKNGSSGAPVAGPSTLKEDLAATPHTSGEPSKNALSRKQSPSLAASTGSETKLCGLGSEGQLRAGSKQGSASGNLNPAMEALLARGRETQAGDHKSGASASPGPSPCLISQPAVAGPHTSLGTGTYGSTDGGVGGSVSPSVGDQILDSLNASMAQGDREVLIRLQPPELGMVLVRFREQGQSLDGTLRVERTDTRREIEQVLPEVVRSLQDAGIGIRRLDVTDSDPTGQDLGRGQLPQDGSSGHGDAGQDRDWLWTSSASRPPAAVDSTWDSPRVPEGRIDMLL